MPIGMPVAGKEVNAIRQLKWVGLGIWSADSLTLPNNNSRFLVVLSSTQPH